MQSGAAAGSSILPCRIGIVVIVPSLPRSVPPLQPLVHIVYAVLSSLFEFVILSAQLCHLYNRWIPSWSVDQGSLGPPRHTFVITNVPRDADAYISNHRQELSSHRNGAYSPSYLVYLPLSVPLLDAISDGSDQNPPSPRHTKQHPGEPPTGAGACNIKSSLELLALKPVHSLHQSGRRTHSQAQEDGEG